MMNSKQVGPLQIQFVLVSLEGFAQSDEGLETKSHWG